MPELTLELDNRTVALLRQVAAVGEDAAALAQLVDLDPAQFEQFLSDIGQLYDQDAQLLLEASRAHVRRQLRMPHGTARVSSPTTLFRMVSQIPSQTWYDFGIISALASLVLYLLGNHRWADVVGTWTPTFLFVGLYHTLVQTDGEAIIRQMQRIERQYATAR